MWDRLANIHSVSPVNFLWAFAWVGSWNESFGYRAALWDSVLTRSKWFAYSSGILAALRATTQFKTTRCEATCTASRAVLRGASRAKLLNQLPKTLFVVEMQNSNYVSFRSEDCLSQRVVGEQSRIIIDNWTLKSMSITCKRLWSQSTVFSRTPKDLPYILTAVSKNRRNNIFHRFKSLHFIN